MCQISVANELDFIEPMSQCDYDLIQEVANCGELESILTMVLLDDTLSESLRAQVRLQLANLKVK